MNIETLHHDTVLTLAALYGKSEAQWLARIIFERLKNWDRTYLVLHGTDQVDPFVSEQIHTITSRLLKHEPIQQIFGRARFHGLDFEVNRHTLIPRPETAEMVDFIIDEAANRPDLTILDIGTGSGCIAVSLARALPFPNISAIDISAEAIRVASGNARRLNAKVTFNVDDALHLAPRPSSYDFIVSNPPYILPSEKTGMSQNVLLYEPHSALFVPENEPLLFIDAISRFAFASLKPGGNLWVEINPLLDVESVNSIKLAGFRLVETIPDSHGKMRFLHAQKTEE